MGKIPNPSWGLCLLALLAAAAWFLSWPWVGGVHPLHAYHTPESYIPTRAEGTFYLFVTLAQAPLLLALALLMGRYWDGRTRERIDVYLRRPLVTYAAVAMVAAAFAFIMSQVLVRGQALTEDEKTYIYQARLLLSGGLTTEPPAVSQAFYQPFIVEAQGRWSGQYFWAHPLLLVPPLLLGVPHLASAVLFAFTIFFGARLAEDYTGSSRTGLLAAVLLASSPMLLMLGSTLHNANLAACCATASLWALLRLRRGFGWGPTVALALSTGLALHNRLLDHAALLAAAAVLLWVSSRGERWPVLRRLVPAVAMVVPVLLLHLWINSQVSGNPLRSGYSLFNDQRGWTTFGFGMGPFHWEHTPSLSALKTLTNFTHVLLYSTGSAWPFLLVAAGGLGLWRRGSAAVWAPAVFPALYFLAYYFYAGWSVTYAGPVYFAALVAVLVPWIAVLLHALHRDLVPVYGPGVVPGAALALLLVSGVLFWPTQWVELGRSASMSATCEDIVAEAGFNEALVFVGKPNIIPAAQSWVYRPPMARPDASDPVLFVHAQQDKQDTQDREVARHHARGRPILLAMCLQTYAPLLYRYDPVTSKLERIDEAP
jgi:4-amino-4-deoxy-L-arabinose transferase-like glycosyltransferase